MVELKFVLLLFLSAFVPGLLTAQPKAFASLQPDRIETGDTTALLILVSGLNAAPKDVDFLAWASVLPASNLLSKSDWRQSGTQWTRRYTLIAFDSAKLELPPLTVLIGNGKSLMTNELTLNVFPTRGGSERTDMAKIRDIRREPESWMDYWPWAAGLGGVLFLLAWWWRRRQPKPPALLVQPLPVKPSLSAAEKALQKLTELQQKQLWKQQQFKEHYAELSLILREYLENRFGIAALESTTDEIQKLLKATDFPVALRPDLKEILQKTDLVKYAQSQPNESVHEAVLIKARELVSPAINKVQSAPAPPTPKPSKPASGKYEPL